MNVIALTIPERPDEQISWLERHLLGPDLGLLAAELSAVHGDREPPESVAELLGPHKSALLERGLAALPRSTIRELMRHPAHLLDLQELVLIEGGEYWEQLLNRPEVTDAIAAPPRNAAMPKGKSGTWRGYFAAALVSAVAVAAVFVVVDPVQWMRPKDVVQAKTERGWNRADTFANEATATAYLQKVAKRSEEFSSSGEAGTEQVLARIGEFRTGCSRFLLASHSQLPPEMRDDLKKRCRKWSDELDKQRIALETDPSKAAVISGEIDALVARLAGVLRKQAEQLQAG